MRTAGAVVAALTAATLAACGTSGAPRDSQAPSTSTPSSTPSTTPSAKQPSPPRSGTAARPSPTAELNAALIKAAWANDVPTARRLIAQGADVNHKDETEQSAYLIATSEGYLELLDLTLQHGADVHSLDSYRGNGMIRAAERGHAHIIGRLLRAKADVNLINRLNYNALDEAVLFGDGSPRFVETVRLLVSAGSQIRTTATTNARGAVKAVLDAAAQRPAQPAAALLAAAERGDADAVAAALRAGAPIEARDGRRRTALLLAATFDRVDTARLLVLRGADPDALDDRHDTPWLVTGVTGSVAMLETLLPANPDMTIRNRFGGISVIPAAERGHVDYVRRVVRTKIDVNHVNDLGYTALLEAVIYGDGSSRYQEIVRILLAAGADRSIADGGGVTPLEHARRRGQVAVAALLAR